jgi:hypothetical protein
MEGAHGLSGERGALVDEEEGDSGKVEASRPLPGVSVPGFVDPAAAEPGFWIREPGGAVRRGWYRDLKRLLGMEEPSDDEST